MKMDAVIGHRGAAKVAPENTLAGIKAAHELGVSWVEIDVVLLADGELVIHHDRTLNRCTSGRGELLSLTLAEVKAVDASVQFKGGKFTGERVPTLKDALDLIDELGMGVNLEIKMHKHTPEALTLKVLEQIHNHPLLAKERFIISSFDHEVLMICREQKPEVLLGHLFERLPKDWREQVNAVNAVTVHCSQRLLKRSQAQDVVGAGYELYCYTVNSSQRAAELLSWGVSGVFTDDPESIKAALL